MYDFNRKPEAAKAQSWLLEKLAEVKTSDKLIVLVVGAFDIPHLNHDWFLRHY